MGRGLLMIAAISFKARIAKSPIASSHSVTYIRKPAQRVAAQVFQNYAVLRE